MDDFVPIVQRDCVPIVRAMKEYQRDHGSYPDDVAQLVPQYLPGNPEHPGFHPMIGKGYFGVLSLNSQLIEYDCGSEEEAWRIIGGYVSGRMPLPPVTLDPPASTARQE
jgi:hypothetical protein